jgi:uncharacterized membrane protein
MRTGEFICAAIVVVSFVISFILYPSMPEQMPTHWDAQGQVNGHASKAVALFIMPVISFFLFLLFIAVPRVDPLKKNVAKFRNYFDGFIVAVFLFLFYLYFLTMAWPLGFRFDMIRMLSPAFGFLFYCAGILISKAKRNWFIGIRTPWTMSSDRVWDRTHELGGKLFKAAGIIAFFGVFFRDHVLGFVLVPVIAAAVYTFVYSYFEYKKETKGRRRAR